MKLGATTLLLVGLGLLLFLTWDGEEVAAGPQIARVQHSKPTGFQPVVQSQESDQAIERALARLPSEIGETARVSESPKPKSGFVPTTGCTSRKLLSSLLAAPREKLLKCIWDAADFNPRRVVVSAADREKCSQSLQAYLDSAAELRKIANHSAMGEFRQLVEQRNAGLPFISQDHYLAIVKKRAPRLLDDAMVDGVLDKGKVLFMPALAFDFDVNLFREAEGGWYSSRIADMSTARPAYEAMAFTSHELVRSIIHFCLTFGTLNPAEAEALNDSAHRMFNRMIH